MERAQNRPSLYMPQMVLSDIPNSLSDGGVLVRLKVGRGVGVGCLKASARN